MPEQHYRHKKHPIILVDYGPRFFGHVIAGTIIATMLYTRPTPLYQWAILFFIMFVWSHLCLLISWNVKNPKPYEFFFLVVDSFMVGCWIGYLDIQPWPATCIIASVCMANMSMNGVRQYLTSLLAALLGVFIFGFIQGFNITIHSQLITVLAGAVCLFTFTSGMGYVAFIRSRYLRRTKRTVQKSNQEVLNINHIIQASITTLNIDNMINQIIQVVKELFKFDTVTLQLADYVSDHLNFYAGYGEFVTQAYADNLRKVDIKISEVKSVSVRTLRTGKIFYREHITPTMPMLDKDRQVFDLNPFLSVLMIPIIIKNEKLGVITFSAHNSNFTLSSEQIETIKRYVSQLAMVVKNAALFLHLQENQKLLSEKNDRLSDLSKRLSHYLSPQIYDEIFSGKKEVKVSSSRKRLTIFFSDIAGFTDMTDRIEAEFLTKLINEYLTEMSQIAIKYGGTIDKYIGAAIMIFFGDPATKGVQQDAINCVLMAIEMQIKLRELATKWQDEGISEAIRVRVGITSGFCAVGNFGSTYRLDYTIMGTQVNLASRLQTRALPDEILIAESTYLLVKDVIKCEEKSEVLVKGMAHPVKVFTVNEAMLPEGTVISVEKNDEVKDAGLDKE